MCSIGHGEAQLPVSIRHPAEFRSTSSAGFGVLPPLTENLPSAPKPRAQSGRQICRRQNLRPPETELQMRLRVAIRSLQAENSRILVGSHKGLVTFG